MPEANRQKQGYRLGMEYLANASWLERAMGPLRGTIALYLAPSTYAVTWSTNRLRQQKPTAGDAKGRKRWEWYFVLAFGYYILLAAALWGVKELPHYRFTASVVLCGTAMTNWIGYAVIFWAKSRYRYLPEVMFCILAGMAFSRFTAAQHSLNGRKNARQAS